MVMLIIIFITEDLVFGAVKGGAAFAALSDFPTSEKYDVSEIEKKNRSYHFYYIALGYSPNLYWGRQLNTTKSALMKNHFLFRLMVQESNEERFCISDSSDD